MKRSALLVAGALVVALAPGAMADGRKPGSVLVYPIHRSGSGDPGLEGGEGFAATFFTAICVTNTNLIPSIFQNPGGTTGVHFEYVNVTPDPDPLKTLVPLFCQVQNQHELLTPADTKCVLTSCHNPAPFNSFREGYVVVSAEDPTFPIGTKWAFDYLIGSEVFVSSIGGMYILNAVPFKAGNGGGGEGGSLAEGDHTDLDNDGQLDFDGIEYEPMPAELYLDSFIAISGSSLTLSNFTGGFDFIANISIDIWNDSEQAMSQTLGFKCWFEERLTDLSLFFTQPFLLSNMPNDPTELDITCDSVADLETGWARIVAFNASSSVETIPGAAMLGALTAGPGGPKTAINGGHLLWESDARNFTGDFFKFGTDDPEFPPP